MLIGEVYLFLVAEEKANLKFYDGGGWKNLSARKYNVVRLPVHLIADQKGMIQLIGRSGGDEETERVKAMVARLIGE